MSGTGRHAMTISWGDRQVSTLSKATANRSSSFWINSLTAGQVRPAWRQPRSAGVRLADKLIRLKWGMRHEPHDRAVEGGGWSRTVLAKLDAGGDTPCAAAYRAWPG